MKKTLLTILACAAVCACTSEKISTPDVQKTFDGDVAYIVVNINDVNSSSTRASDGGFQYGTATEYAVSDAHFYFYGSDGDFVSESNAWNDGTATEYQEGDTYGNIEFEGYTVLTLHGLTSKSYPSWVVTVLNKPESFTAPQTIGEFEGLLANVSTDGTASGYYTMSTSSYVGNTYYFATPVSAENFSLEEIDLDNLTDAAGENIVPIEIYVERLAAKVTLNMDEDLVEGAVTYSDNETLFPIPVEQEIEGVATPVVLYVRIDGWALNGTAKNSNMTKTIDTSWEFTWGGGSEGWNDATNYRSYWGKSFNYGVQTSYPSTSGGATNGTTLNDYLDYVSYNDLALGLGEYEYCVENTNTAGQEGEIISSKTSTAITNILVAATIGTLDEDNAFVPADLVRVGGLLYTQEDYLEYAASHLHLYVMTQTTDASGDTVTTYTRVDPDYLEIVHDVDGFVYVAFKEAYEDTTFYTISTSTDGDGNTTAEVTGTYDYETANAYVQDNFNDIYGYGANGYNGGTMYYSIPVEHLNNTVGTDANGDTYPLEGNYGIVRNHIYSVTITGVENIGWGDFDPDEVIIPQTDYDTYSLTANINILSWKLVNQSAVL